MSSQTQSRCVICGQFDGGPRKHQCPPKFWWKIVRKKALPWGAVGLLGAIIGGAIGWWLL